jgi:hypothetical protein
MPRPKPRATEGFVLNDTTTKLAAAAALMTFMAAPEIGRYTPGHAALAAAPNVILSNAVAEPAHVRVSVNGGPFEKLGLEGYGDVTNAHAGRNTLLLRWGGPIARLDFRITASTSPNNARDVLVVRDDASRDPALRRPGSRTYTFELR